MLMALDESEPDERKEAQHAQNYLSHTDFKRLKIIHSLSKVLNLSSTKSARAEMMQSGVILTMIPLNYLGKKRPWSNLNKKVKMTLMYYM